MDEYRENVKKVQKALNQDAAFIQPNPYLAQRVLNAANVECVGKGGLTVRKKFSMSFVLTFILIIFSLTAVAAVVLSGTDFVNQYLAPMADTTESDSWSQEELRYIKEIAEQNGVQFSEEIMKEFASEDKVFKETLMRLFMKMELGDSPASWTVADQAWYDELLFSHGLVEERTRFVPEGDELTEDEAVAIATEYVRNNWGVDVSVATNCRQYVQYMLSTDVFGNPARIWNIEFECDDGYVYVVCISNDGEVINDSLLSYVHAPDVEDDQIEDMTVLPADIDELVRLMSEDSFYNVYTLASFSEKYGKLINDVTEKSPEHIQVMFHLLDIPYATPKETDIKPEEAWEIARKWAYENGWSEEWLEWCKSSISYRIYNGEEPIYRVCFKLKATNRQVFYQRQMPFGFVVYIDPVNGNVTESLTLNELDDFERYCEFPDLHDNAENPGNG